MPAANLDELDLDWLENLHANKRLELSPSVGLAGVVHLNRDPQALVDELIRLARVGQAVERRRKSPPSEEWS